MPFHCDELPPSKAAPEDSGGAMAKILDIALDRRTSGIGQHKLANWPTKY
ncbi:MAG: hypothetical protein JW943_14070 [Deltaproteobacteria bacterium]|nr:hypothetical protein [Deltaproteobacteria bacterium]